MDSSLNRKRKRQDDGDMLSFPKIPCVELIGRDIHKYSFATFKNRSPFIKGSSLEQEHDCTLVGGLYIASIEIENKVNITHFDRNLTRSKLIHALKEHISLIDPDQTDRIEIEDIGEEEQKERISEPQIKKEPQKKSRRSPNSTEKDTKIQDRHAGAMHMYLQKVPIAEIARYFGVAPNTIKKWAYLFKKGKLRISNGPPRNIKLKQQYLDEIESFLSHPKKVCSSLQEIRRHLIQRFELSDNDLSLNSIHRWVKRAGFSYKRMKTYVQDRNSELKINERMVYAADFTQYLLMGKEFIFLDETGFNSAMMPIYGYSKIGKRCYYQGKIKGPHYSVVCAISKDRLLGFQIFEGSVQFNELGVFLIELLKNYPEILQRRSKYYFIMDNARSHKAINFKPFADNLNIIFNVSYSPFLNPIEEMFGLWKYHFRKINFQSTDISVPQAICLSAEKLRNDKLVRFYIHALDYILASLKGLKIN